MIRPLTLAVLTCLSLPATAQSAANAGPDEGRVVLNLRYRYEHVDQDNALRNANAQTLRTRLGYETGQWHGFSALVEMEHVGRLFGSPYNSTRNGRADYAVVADPSGTSLNQALLRHQGDYGMVSIGRQRINLDNQRFVGAVGWRQNEQTFDAALARLNANDNLSLTYAWLDKVHTLFGPDDDHSTPANRARIDSNSHLLNLNWAIEPRFNLMGYHYRLDLKDAAISANAPLGTLSSATTGLRVYGAAGAFDYTVEYARQKDTADNPWDLDSRYKFVELGYKIQQLKLKIGLESLGGDTGEGNRAFQTPLATKHLFQGWADQFLTTPADGLDDLYLSAQLGIGDGGSLQAQYHDFSSERGSTDFGTEIGLAYSQPLHPWGIKGLTGTVKYARYDSDDSRRSVDTDKFWLQLEYAY